MQNMGPLIHMHTYTIIYTYNILCLCLQAEGRRTEWAEAMYDFTPAAEDELAFVQGDMILVTEHLDADWCCGRLNGREGIFPTAFVRTCSGTVLNIYRNDIPLMYIHITQSLHCWSNSAMHSIPA